MLAWLWGTRLPAHQQSAPYADLVAAFPDVDPSFLLTCLAHFAGKRHPPGMTAITAVHAKLAEMGYTPRRDAACDASPTSAATKNVYLASLSAAFPRHPIPLLRAEIDASQGAFVDHVAQRLLDDVKLRSAATRPLVTPSPMPPAADRFRSDDYVAACRRQLAIDFPDAWTTSVTSVMQAHNNDYVQAHLSLQRIEAQRRPSTARFLTAVSRMFSRSAASSPSHAPPDDFLADRAALERHFATELAEKDAEMARNMNEKEYEEGGMHVECACCYTAYTMEDMGQCAEGHL